MRTKEKPRHGDRAGLKGKFPVMNIHNTSSRRCKASASNDGAHFATSLTPMEAYAVRALARRAGISFNHALLAAQLAGIVREVRHV
jgi:hypothetical protein